MEKLHLGQRLESGGAFELGGSVGLIQYRDRLTLEREGLVVALLEGAGSRQHGEGDPVLVRIGGVRGLGDGTVTLEGILGGWNVPQLHRHPRKADEGRQKLGFISSKAIIGGRHLKLVHGQGLGESALVLIESRQIAEARLETPIRRRELLRDGEGCPELLFGPFGVANGKGVLTDPGVTLPGGLGEDRQGKDRSENQ